MITAKAPTKVTTTSYAGNSWNGPQTFFARDPIAVASASFASQNSNRDGTQRSLETGGGGGFGGFSGWEEAREVFYGRPVAPNKPIDPLPEKLTDKPTPALPPSVNTPILSPTPAVTPPSVTPPTVAPPTTATPLGPNSRRPSNLRIDSTARHDTSTRDTRTPARPEKTEPHRRETPSEKQLREDRLCGRPDDNRPKGGGGGKGNFIPWQKKC